MSSEDRDSCDLSFPELSFDKIDQWVRSKYCVTCTFRATALEYRQLSTEWNERAESVFRKLLISRPCVVDDESKLKSIVSIMETILLSGGRVIVVLGV